MERTENEDGVVVADLSDEHLSIVIASVYVGFLLLRRKYEVNVLD